MLVFGGLYNPLSNGPSGQPTRGHPAFYVPTWGNGTRPDMSLPVCPSRLLFRLVSYIAPKSHQMAAKSNRILNIPNPCAFWDGNPSVETIEVDIELSYWRDIIMFPIRGLASENLSNKQRTVETSVRTSKHSVWQKMLTLPSSKRQISCPSPKSHLSFEMKWPRSMLRKKCIATEHHLFLERWLSSQLLSGQNCYNS